MKWKKKNVDLTMTVRSDMIIVPIGIKISNLSLNLCLFQQNHNVKTLV